MFTSSAFRMAAITVVFAAATLPVRGTAQQQAGQSPVIQRYSGSALYDSYCAMCHGSGGKGDGAFAGTLRTAPPDLTVLAKNNGGTFSSENVARIVDGRNPVKGHGGRDMPVWGEAFAHSADGPDSVAEKIQSLVQYLESIQQKP